MRRSGYWLACWVASVAVVAAADPPPLPDKNREESARSRLAVMGWWCAKPGMLDTAPCENFKFLTLLKQAATHDEKKAIVVKRLEARRARRRDKAAVALDRTEYVKMYKLYCTEVMAKVVELPLICKQKMRLLGLNLTDTAKTSTKSAS